MDIQSLLRVKVKSVSKIEEAIGESIVPVTLITQTMIRSSGARTLNDLLISYVPGMTFVQDQNEVNVAMRGVYSSAQQKILVLLDGHRLNSRLISAANLDHSIGLDKIKQIEITRGPGSSVYGNVALTAVVNIVLLKAEQIDSTEVAVAIGDHGQRKVSINYGHTFDNGGDLFSWFYGYKNQGEKVTITPENDYARSPAEEPVDSIIGGFFDKPAYDIGAKFNTNDWSFLINQRRAHYVEPFTSVSLTGEAFNYQDYEQRFGIGPGFQYTFLHLSAEHNYSLGSNLEWKNRLYYDESDMEATFVFSPAIQLFGQGTMYDRTKGLISQLTWQETWGTFLLGYQYDQMTVYKSDFPFGTGGNYSGDLFSDEKPLVQPGKEDAQSLYSVFKYYLDTNWITNIGFRYDVKNRLTLSDQKNLSPRIGLVYLNDNGFNFKASFSESFVDSPYWNRYGALPSFRGSETLAPEKLKSFQLTPSWHFFENKISYELNLFHNTLNNAVFRNNLATQDEPINTNAGKVKSWGHEHQLVYRVNDWQFRLLGFFNRVIEFEDFSARGDEIFNIPNETINLITDYKVNDHFHLNLQLQYQASQLSPININLDGVAIVDPYPDSGVNYQVPNNRLPSRTITNLSFVFDDVFSEKANLEFHFYNLFDVNYQQGGTTLHPYQQEGRWMQAQLRYNF